MSDPHPPISLQAVQMNDAGKCSRCLRDVLLLECAFLDENYATVCHRCAADAYNAKKDG